jgi:hypothetical protein
MAKPHISTQSCWTEKGKSNKETLDNMYNRLPRLMMMVFCLQNFAQVLPELKIAYANPSQLPLHQHSL